VSAREEILGRVRAALADADPTPPAVDRAYRNAVIEPSPDLLDLVDLFVERVEDYRAEVHRCAAGEVEDVLADLLGQRTTVVPEGFDWAVPQAVRDTGLSAAELDEVEAVVTTSTVGIALTGTIVLDHGPGQGRRALSLVPDLHVCVVRADDLVAGVSDAVARLDPSRPQTWISGPSATSDIELNRVEGVHGPRTLRVVLVSS
jgi:L-lactate dehydrogenase complex protein LldG